jgi:hypothetical protein
MNWNNMWNTDLTIVILVVADFQAQGYVVSSYDSMPRMLSQGGLRMWSQLPSLLLLEQERL